MMGQEGILKEEFSSLFPKRFESLTEKELRVINDLVEKRRKSKEVQVEVCLESDSVPTYLSIVIVGRDWPGLVNTISGELHEKSLNICFVLGARSRESDLAIVLLKSLIEDPKVLKEIKEELDDLKHTLKMIAAGGKSIQRLVHIGSKKISVYINVFRELEKRATPEEFKEIVKEDGELEKFILSRSEAYLTERSPEILADIILNNYRMIQELRHRSHGVIVRAWNFKTTREHLTAVTVAGFEKDLSLDDVLERIRSFYPNFIRKFDKQFTTPDGITIIHLEITDEHERPFPPEKLRLMVESLKSDLSKPRQKAYLGVIFGGEIFGRIVIPQLAMEYAKSEIPQLYIIPTETNPTEITYRIILIGPLKDGTPADKITSKIISSIEGTQGLKVTSYKYPSRMGKGFAFIFAVKATRAYFPNEEEIYEAIKRSIEKIIPKVRDFDEGMRTQDRKKLKEIEKIFESRSIDIDEKFIKEYFYSIDDFLRYQVPATDIADEILFAHKLLMSYFKEGGKIIRQTQEKGSIVRIGVVGPANMIDFMQYVEKFAPFGPFFVKLDVYGATILVLDIWKENLKGKDISELLGSVEKTSQEVK